LDHVQGILAMKLRDWRQLPFSVRVMAPIGLAITITFGLAATFGLWSTARSDERALDRQVQLVRHILDKEKLYLSEAQDDVSPYDEAVEALSTPIDMEFVHKQLGGEFYDSYLTHRIYVLNPRLEPVYAMGGGGRAPLESFDADAAVVRALATQLQTPQALSAIDAFENGRGDVPTAADFVIVDGRAALASVIPILGHSDDVVVPPGKAYFHVAMRFLDEGLAGELKDAYLLEQPGFAADDRIDANQAALPIANASGEVIAWFKWSPDRPGRQILSDSGPYLLAALLAGGLVIGLLLFRVDRASRALEAAQQAAQHRAVHDPLTGLCNRAGFEDHNRRIRAELARGGAPVALLALDLDRFKQVNDTLGHDAGDRLLRQVADRLRPLVREVDLIARLGGDEFVVLMQRVDGPGDATALASSIVAHIAEPYMIGAHDVRIGVSIGIALAATAADFDDLAQRADFALYEAKEGGRNQFRLYGAAGSDNVVGLARPSRVG